MKPVQSAIPPRGFYYAVSDRLYAAIQRAVAFTLMTNQRYCYSRFKELNMDNRRVAILKSEDEYVQVIVFVFFVQNLSPCFRL